jgi:hypothetical protein
VTEREKADAERRDLLERYLRACVRDSVLSWADLLGGDGLDNLMRAASADLRAVLAAFGKRSGRGALRVLGAALMGLGAEPDRRR